MNMRLLRIPVCKYPGACSLRSHLVTKNSLGKIRYKYYYQTSWYRFFGKEVDAMFVQPGVPRIFGKDLIQIFDIRLLGTDFLGIPVCKYPRRLLATLAPSYQELIGRISYKYLI